MPKKPGAYYRPSTLEAALRYLSEPGTAPLAGGTQLLAQEEGVSLAAVVDLQDLGLDQISVENDQLRVGAMVTLDSLDQYLLREQSDGPGTDLLHKAIRQAGPNTYRNAATLGGICASRLPDSELLAALLVIEALFVCRSPEVKSVAVVDYLEREATAGELITEILIPWEAGRGASERVARTPKDYPIVSVTVWRPDVGSPRLAATGLGERPRRLFEAEGALSAGEDGALQAAAIEAAAEAARSANRHPGDFRGDADYRADMAAVLTRRVLNSL